MLNDIDAKIGAIIRARRTEIGLSQEALAAKIGVTFQQVQKYEKGTNALNARRLIDMSQALRLPVAAFFADIPAVPAIASERESLEHVKAFNAIKSYAIRKRISDLARALS